MPDVQYGNRTIKYSIYEKTGLKSHYISVAQDEGVVLKGSRLSLEASNQLILKKARWIIEKLELVQAQQVDEIVTGSRMQYLGRKYYVQLVIDDTRSDILIRFTASKFQVNLPASLHSQRALKAAFQRFFQQKAKEKITPRVRKWSKLTGLDFEALKFRQLEKRWGSCTPSNNIIINTDAIKLPFTLIDYLIVHELAHTKVKNHSQAFWAEVSKHIPNWRELDSQLYGMKL